MNIFFPKKKNIFVKYNNGGLTLVELLVVVSIFMIVTGISIFNYGKFNSYTGTQNLADDIALTIRQAQSYAIGVRGVEGDNPFNVSYGVDFSINPNPGYYNAASSDSFVLFADIDGDNLYDHNINNSTCGEPKEGDECLEVFTVKTDDKISDILLNGQQSIDKESFVNMMFKRPNPEPVFCYTSGTDCVKNFSYISIKVSNQKEPDKIYKIIEVSNVGQISVK